MNKYCFPVVMLILGFLLISIPSHAEYSPVIGSLPDMMIIGDEEDNLWVTGALRFKKHTDSFQFSKYPSPDIDLSSISGIEDSPENRAGYTVDLCFFKYQNAFNLDKYVFDMDTPTSEIRWSFFEDPAGPDGALDNFEINGVTQLDNVLNAVDPGEKEITGCVDPDFRNPLVSIWDIRACPYKDSVTSYNTSLQEVSEDILVTFFASDGTNVDSASMMITSLPDGRDFLNPSRPFGTTYAFDDPDAEGWRPYHKVPGTHVADPLGGYYIAPAFADSGAIGIENAGTSNVYGSWQMKYEISLDYESDYLYKARYALRTDQEDPYKVPQVRMRWSDFPSLVSSGHIIDKGSNALTTDWRTCSSYYYQPTASEYMGRNMKLYLDLVDFSKQQQGSIFCDSIEVSRIDAPETGGTVVAEYDDPADFSRWRYFSAEAFDKATSGTDASGIWLETPEPVGDASLCYGAFSNDPENTSLNFEDNMLYKCTFTLSCESEEAREHLPSIRLRVSNGAYDWISFREIRQTGGVVNHMPAPEGTEYPIFIESPPHPVIRSGECDPNAIITSFDVVDGNSEQCGCVTLDKVVIEKFPLE